MNYASFPVQTTSDTVQASPRTSKPEAVSLNEAAVLKGLTLDALRKRLQRGHEDGYKGNDGRWRVHVTEQELSQDRPRTDRSRLSNVQGRAMQALLDEVRERLNDKNGVIAYLKAQIMEKDKLVSQLVEKLPDAGPDASSDRFRELTERNKQLELEKSKSTFLLRKAYEALEKHAKTGN